jgi:hypothetical protein
VKKKRENKLKAPLTQKQMREEKNEEKKRMEGRRYYQRAF